MLQRANEKGTTSCLHYRRQSDSRTVSNIDVGFCALGESALYRERPLGATVTVYTCMQSIHSETVALEWAFQNALKVRAHPSARHCMVDQDVDSKNIG
jgi:hypothetical protein